MADRAAPEIGDVFGGYTIESLLGRGGMGTVYLATHERLARRVALKVIAPALADDEDFRARFLRESQLAASLDHANVIPIYDADEVDGVLFLAMRYVQGPNLQALIRERGRFSTEQTLRVAEQIGGALDAAHRAGLVHRDVKPANILLAEPEDHAYLCDFGLAKRTSSQGMTRVGSFLGSVDYCAPEQIEGRAVDGRADIYSLGSVLFHCLAGEPPYTRETEIAVLHAHLADPPPALSSVRADLPSAIDTVISTAIAKVPEDRYRTAGTLASALRAAMTGRGAPLDADATRAAPASATPLELGESATTVLRPVRRRSGASFGLSLAGRRVWLIGVVVLVVALAGASVAVIATRGSDGGSSTAPSAADMRTFVERVENVLVQSAAGRAEIGDTLAKGLDCSISPREAGNRIASVADNRQSILTQLGSLPTPTRTADDIVTKLQRALQQSIEADRHYRDGFFDAADSEEECPLPGNPAFDLAVAADARATQAKEQFVTAFNPLAQRFDRRVWLAGEI